MNQVLWLTALAVLLLIEAATVGLTTIWFAGGALTALIASFFGAGTGLQIGLFLLVSLVLLVFTRPAAVRLLNKKTERTNVDALPGKTAVVKETIDNLAETGVVHVNGLDWSARSLAEDEKIPADTVVVIECVRGVKLLVHPAEKTAAQQAAQ